MPESAALALGPIAPRFYAVSESFEAALVLPFPIVGTNFPAGGTGAAGGGKPAILFVAGSGENSPVSGAKVSAEILAPKARKLDVTSGTASGTYAIQGLDSRATETVSIEVESGALLEILTFAAVVRPPPAAAGPAASGAARGASGTLGAPPPALTWGLAAAAAALMVANAVGLAVWAGRRGARPPGPVVWLLAGATMTAASGRPAPAQAAGAGAIHFVAIDTQFQADIRTTRAVETTRPGSIKTFGTIRPRPDREATVTAPAEGRLMPPSASGAIAMAGDRVAKGDVLARLRQTIPVADRVALAGERSQAESDAAEAGRRTALAATALRRAEALGALAPRKELDQARLDHQVAVQKEAGLRARGELLAGALDGGASPLRDIPIVAPVSGVVEESHATAGESVGPSKTLFHIVDLAEVFAEAEIFETDLAAVANAGAADGTAKVPNITTASATAARISTEAYPGRSFAGSLRSVGQQVDPATRTVRAVFAVPNPGGLLKAGMSVDVAIDSGAARPVVLVPKSALFASDGGRVAFLKTSPETYAATLVEVAGYREGMAEIARGLKPGDRVAVSGLYQVRMAPVVGVVATPSGAVAGAR